MIRMQFWGRAAVAVALTAAAVYSGCGNQPKYDTNLLKNGSFESVGSDGIPKDWKLVLFRGGPDDPKSTTAPTRSHRTARSRSTSRPTPARAASTSCSRS